MQIEKHLESLSEVYATINEALNDPKGLLGYQRRIALMISLGAQQLIELHFHKLNIIKPGAQIKHEWFKLDEKNLKYKLSSLLTKNLDDIQKIKEILFLANQIEFDRNDLAYGAPLKEDKKLKEKVDTFLELKNIIEGSL